MLSSYFSYWRGSSAHLLEFLTPSSKELDDLHLSFLRAFGSIYISNFFETVLGFIERQRSKYTVSFRLRGASIVGTFVGRTNELQQIGEEHEVDLWELLNLAWKCKVGFAESESDLQSPEAFGERTGSDYDPESN